MRGAYFPAKHLFLSWENRIYGKRFTGRGADKKQVTSEAPKGAVNVYKRSAGKSIGAFQELWVSQVVRQLEYPPRKNLFLWIAQSGLPPKEKKQERRTIIYRHTRYILFLICLKYSSALGAFFWYCRHKYSYPPEFLL